MSFGQRNTQQTLDLKAWCNFTPKQMEATLASDQHRFLFYGGAAGGGKSEWLRRMCIRLLLRYFSVYGVRGVRVMVACMTYTELYDRQISKIESNPHFLKFGEYRSSKREFHLFPEYGGGVICFRNLDDPVKYSSSEFAAILVDELTLCPEEVFEELRIRLRWPGIPGHETRFIGTGNPRGVGIGWVKRYWIDRTPANEKDDIGQYHFVQAFVTDNPHLDPSYAQHLDMLPENLRRALRYGDWDVFKGQFFAQDWRRNVHVIEPFQIPKGLGVWYRSLDWGYTAPAACGLWWLSPDNNLYRVREVYKTGLRPSELAAEIKAMTGDISVSCTVADPSIFAKNPEYNESIADILAKNGVPCIPANNDRLNGWARMREWLKIYEVPVPEDEVRRQMQVLDEQTGDWAKPHQWRAVDNRWVRDFTRLHVFSTCRDAIRTIPNMVHSDTRPEDMETKGVEDHVVDEIRYICLFLPPPSDVSVAAGRVVRDEPRHDNTWRQMMGLVPRDDVVLEDENPSGW